MPILRHASATAMPRKKGGSFAVKADHFRICLSNELIDTSSGVDLGLGDIQGPSSGSHGLVNEPAGQPQQHEAASGGLRDGRRQGDAPEVRRDHLAHIKLVPSGGPPV